jgi:uncharacterized protein YgiM (DUF1202 family)
MKKAILVLALGAIGGVALPAGDAQAAPGDVYRVAGEKVNLRSGPSDQSNIRSSVAQGDELIELRSQGPWVGVRVLRTGEEGWVFGDLVRRTTQSSLGGGGGSARPEAGFAQISPGFDQLLANMSDQLGYRFAEKVDRSDGNTLRVTPTTGWLYGTSRDAKLMTALAVHEMWKSYNNGRPVNMSFLDGRGGELMSIKDSGSGPLLDLVDALAMN